MKTLSRLIFFILAWTAQSALAAYPCPAGPGPGEQQVGVGGGSHGIAAVPMCVQTGGGSGGAGAGGGGYAGYRCNGCNIFATPAPKSAADIQREKEQAEENQKNQKRLMEIQAKLQKMEADLDAMESATGEWTFFQGGKDSAPGDNCVALWSKPGGAVSVVGPGKAYQGGMLIFWGKEIPRPMEMQTIAVTLKQSRFKPQSVNALNFSVPGIPAGAIGLTVPKIDAALNNMLDVEHFTLEMAGRKVADIDWKDGLSARAQLDRCIKGR